MADSSMMAAAVRTKRLIEAILAVAALAVVTERLGYAGLWNEPVSAGLIADIARQIVLALPTAGYLYALWSLRRAAAALASGEAFSPSVVTALRHVGGGLVAGGLLGLIGATMGGWLSAGLSFRSLDLDIANLAIAAVGTGLFLLARLLSLGARQAQELSEFF